MYYLTLTAGERKAIDWVGYRYAHGDQLYKVLWGGSVCNHEDADWDDPRELTFAITEAAAWMIKDIGEESHFRWDCFAPELANKLNKFVDELV